MLYRYRQEYEKIVLGMLSLSKNSDRMNFLVQELQWYEDGDNRYVYLWKDQFHNWAALIGVEANRDNLVVRRLTLTPDDDDLFNVYQILDSLQKEFPDKKIIGTVATKDVIAKWERRNGRN